jgi:hypothetical protein
MSPASRDPFSYLEMIVQVVGKDGDLRLSLRRCQEGCNLLQDIGVALRGVVESRRIYQHNSSPVEGELIRELNLWCARCQFCSDLQVRIAGEVDELED